MFATFKKACIARGLLEDDYKWRICLEEAIAIQPRMACHQLLAVILLTDEVAEPHVLWDQFKARLCDDVVTNFIRSYLHQIFDDSHGLKASLKPLRRPFDRCQSRLKAINIG